MSSTIKLQGSLFPTVPQHTGRYEVLKKSKREHVVIEPGMFTSSRDASPTYLPAQWSSVTHPEGNVYFYRNSGLKMVTEAYIYTPHICQTVLAWAEEIERQFEAKGFVATDAIEAFVQLSGDDCNYYFVDMDTQVLFWLESYETSDLGLLPAVSSSHLKIILEAQYWQHTESFSMHFGGLPQKAMDDLILVMSHALADNITSSLSTFPFDTASCEKFLGLLQSSRDHINDGHIVTFVARIWGMILYNRYETHYGQEQSRLSRDTSIIVDDEVEIQWTKPLFSLASFYTADLYLKRLNSIFVDKYIYTVDWDALMSQCITDWKQTGIMSSILLFLHIFCFFLNVSPVLAYISGSLSILSIITCVLAIIRHEPLQKAGAGVAHDYLTVVSGSRLKFQGVAFAYALPKTLFMWGFIAFVLQGAGMIYQNIPLIPAFLCIGAISAILIAFHFATSMTSFPRPSWSWSWRKNAEKDAQYQV